MAWSAAGGQTRSSFETKLPAQRLAARWTPKTLHSKTACRAPLLALPFACFRLLTNGMTVQAVATKPRSAACRGPCRRRRSAVTAIAAPERPVVPPPERRIPPPEVHSSESER